MSNIRSWLFRGLVITGIAGVVISWLLPWWGCWIVALGTEDKVRIFPYGLWNGLGGWGGFLGSAGDMPWYFTPLMWLYLGLIVAALLFAIWKMNKSIRLMGREFNLSRLLVGIVGLSYVAIIVTFYFYSKMRVAALGVEFIGMSYVEPDVMIHTYVYTGFRVGLWVACAVAPYLILLSLLRNIIVGKPRAISSSDIGG
jgi:hypothetical protein